MPFLLIVAPDHALKSATNIGLTTKHRLNKHRLKIPKRQRRQYLVVPLTESNFADDIAFFSSTNHVPKRLLQRVEEKVKLLRLDESHSKQSARFSTNNTRP